MHAQSFSRRGFLAAMAAAPAAAQAPAGGLKISIFSKHLHWAEWPEMAEVAKEAGFDAIDLTVRKGGHVLPERVAEDLPRAAAIVRKAGLEMAMITTDISDATTPHAETVLKTASSLGIHHYRFGGLRYKDQGNPAEQLRGFVPGMRELGALSARYKMHGMYHTHSGINQVGAPQWDLYTLFKEAGSPWLGYNYDIGHATVEGGFGGWLLSTRLVAPMMKGVALKDFRFVKGKGGEWRPQWCPMGEGMVNFQKFFALLKEQKFNGPLQLHYEYPLGGADTGQKKVTIDKPALIAVLRKDLEFTRSLLREIR
ncbi:MAG: sugar phosphate isomerase/epimerase [Acidobacteria bacterium]|nr:sugar phosphate isomerase/epimerase [Acidobacteriota bacterium]